MTDLEKLSEKMRAEWDRRVDHDYRFWMSDGYVDDQAMWAAGERDYAILTRDLDQKGGTFLDLGCGVGRFLRPASKQFSKVTGVDVSPQALKKAKELLADITNVELLLGNGHDLSVVESKSQDVAMSFAALSTMPAAVISKYLIELNRVLKPDGKLRLQMYVGSSQGAHARDTLHIRCFTEERLQRGLEAAGFVCEWIEELKLPFQVSFKEIGVEAKVISLSKVSEANIDAQDLEKILLPEGEAEGANPSGSPFDYWMAINYAKELVKRGDLGKAEQAVQYAASQMATTAIDVRDLLDRITKEVGSTNSSREWSAEIFEKNLKVLSQRFPEVAAKVEKLGFNSTIEVKATEEGPVILERGQCLDHPQKPKRAAESWASKLIVDPQIKTAASITVLGFGTGYHLIELSKQTAAKIYVVEPSIAAFRTALGILDLSSFIAVASGFSVGGEFKYSEIGGSGELVVRPQTQVLHPEFTQQLRSSFLGERGLRNLTPKIAVMGPLHGGTLPMLPYVSNALKILGQRVNIIDVNNFNGAYVGLEGLVKSVEKRAVLERGFVEYISEAVLQSVQEKPVDIFMTMALAPISGRVLQEMRKMGIVTVHWFVEDHLRFTYWKQMAQHYDFFFTIQKGQCIDKIKAAGAAEVHYLPVACDPLIHIPLTLSAEERAKWGSSISFVGAGYHNRVQTFASLAHLPFKIWGTEWPNCKPFDTMLQAEGRRLSPDEYVKIFNSTDININLHSSSERDGVDPYGDFLNPRTFELAAAGAFQLVDERSLLPEAFEIGTEMATFKNTKELKDKIQYYSEHPQERKEFAERARNRVLRDHTYIHRMQSMLQCIYSSRYEQLKRRDVSSSWSKTLERAKPHAELYQRCDAAYRRGDEPILESLVSDVVTGEGKLTETEQKLVFLYHLQKQIITMRREDAGEVRSDEKALRK